SGGQVTMQAPKLYQDAGDGNLTQVEGSFVLNADSTVGFQAGQFDTTQTLIVDPVLSYSTFLGGSSSDLAKSIAVDGQGNVYITGQTQSSNFPTLNPFQSTLQGSYDVFVTKFNSAGSGLIYSTYLGGTGTGFEVGNAIAVDLAGNAYITGNTTTSNFPTTSGAYQTSNAWTSLGCAFVTKLNATGDALLYSTYLGPVGAPPPAPSSG